MLYAKEDLKVWYRRTLGIAPMGHETEQDLRWELAHAYITIFANYQTASSILLDLPWTSEEARPRLLAFAQVLLSFHQANPDTTVKQLREVPLD